MTDVATKHPDLVQHEEWRAVVGYEGIYEVSSEGRVRRLVQRYFRCERPLATPAIITPKRTGKGYLGVTLCLNGVKVRRYIYRLVLEAFIGPCPPGMEGAHGNGDRQNNRLENLAWKTRSSNHMDKIEHGTMARGETNGASKLTTEKVKAIRADGRLHRVIAAEQGVSRSLIGQIKNGDVWRHV